MIGRKPTLDYRKPEEDDRHGKREWISFIFGDILGQPLAMIAGVLIATALFYFSGCFA